MLFISSIFQNNQQLSTKALLLNVKSYLHDLSDITKSTTYTKPHHILYFIHPLFILFQNRNVSISVVYLSTFNTAMKNNLFHYSGYDTYYWHLTAFTSKLTDGVEEAGAL